MQIITNLDNHFFCVCLKGPKTILVQQSKYNHFSNIPTTNHISPIRYVFDLSGSYHFRIIISNETAYPKNSYDKQKPDTVVVQLSVKLRP